MLTLFASRPFRKLFLARSFSLFASALFFYALLKQMELVTPSSSAFTWFYVAYFAPVFLLGLPIGSLIEQRTLHKIMYTCNLIRFALLFFAAISLFVLPLWSLFLLLVLLSIVDLFYLPASQALLPRIIPENLRPKGNSLFQLAYATLRIAGQLLSAILLSAGFSSVHLLILAAILFATAGLNLMNMPAQVIQKCEKKQLISQIQEGVSYVFHHRTLRPLFLFVSFGFFFASAIDLLLIHFLIDVLQIGVEKLAFIGVATICGVILGSILAPLIMMRIERKWLLLPPFFLLALAFISITLAQSILFVLPFFFIQGIALGTFQVTSVSLIQEWTDPNKYTRTFSLYTLVTTGVALPSVLLIGFMLSTLTVQSIALLLAFSLVFVGVAGILTFPTIGIWKKKAVC